MDLRHSMASCGSTAAKASTVRPIRTRCGGRSKARTGEPVTAISSRCPDSLRASEPGFTGRIAFDLLPALVPGIHLVAAGHRETGGTQVLEAFVVVELGRVTRFGLEDGAGREAAQYVQAADLAAVRGFDAEAAACEQRGMDVEIAGAGDLRARHADVAAGDQREEVPRDHGVARILEIHDVVFDLDVGGRVDGADAGDGAARVQLPALVGDQVLRVLAGLGTLQRALAIREPPRVTAVG